MSEGLLRFAADLDASMIVHLLKMGLPGPYCFNQSYTFVCEHVPLDGSIFIGWERNGKGFSPQNKHNHMTKTLEPNITAIEVYLDPEDFQGNVKYRCFLFSNDSKTYSNDISVNPLSEVSCT